LNPVALIPARGGSKGIPNKNIITFCGLPLIAWSILQAQQAALDVYVSTDNEDIARCARAFGALVLVRPAELASDDAQMADVVRDALTRIDKSNLFDSVILLQPTSPLRLSTDIIKAIERYEKNRSKLLLSCTEQKIIEHTEARILFRNLNRQKIEGRIIEHGMLYIYDCISHPVGNGDLFDGDISVYKTPRWQSFEIDDEGDIELCEYYMRKKNLTCIV
jgi:CMP-N,N'-diacetyllegionaminic acid synthase